MSLKVNEKYSKKLEEELDFIVGDLEQLTKDSPEDLPKVIEDDFIVYLLPYMLNLVDKKENDKAFFNNWMNLVGDVTIGFYVVDENGNPLFKVPRYLGRFDNKNTLISDVSYVTILKEFEAEYERIPEKAVYELDKAMTVLASMLKIDEESLKELFQFYVFLRDRYKDFYISYKTNMLKEQLNTTEQELTDLTNKLEDLDPESKEYEKLVNRIKELEKTKDKIIEDVEKLSGVDYKENDIDYTVKTNENSYEDIDYED